MIQLSLWQRLKLALFGKVSVGPIQKAGWRGPIEHYAFRCPVHGVVIDYPHGHRHLLTCPKCVGGEKR